MIRQLAKLASNPQRYLPVARARFLHLLKRCEHRLTPLFAPTPYYLQSQMDIHPTGRWHQPEFVAAHGGFFVPGDQVERRIAEFEPWDLVRRDMLVLLLRTIVERKIPGDLAELGVYRGNTAKLIHHYMPERVLHLFDTFAGFDAKDLAVEARVTGHQTAEAEFADTSVEGVRQYIAPRRAENVVVHAGFFPGTVPADWAEKQFAFVHLDADLYEPVLAGLRYFYDKVPAGGMIVVHDYNAWPGARRAVDEFFAEKRELPTPMPDKSGSALIVKL